ncbi:MAG: tRNA (adenosine(37)-N6)-threonylcarbamoyltransferase complex dimerization subunit type 1 TsaB [Planctomycetota bacterium]
MTRACLAIETAFPRVGVSLESGGSRHRPRTDLSARRANALHAAVDELLRRAGLGVGDLERVLVDRGPGSYTGLRIGLATARTLRELAGPCIRCLFSTDQLAWASRERLAPEEDFLVCMDARRGHWYAARYRFERAGRLQRLTEPACVPRDQLEDLARGLERLVTPGEAPGLDLALERVGFPPAESLFELEDLALESESPEPLYLLSPV